MKVIRNGWNSAINAWTQEIFLTAVQVTQSKLSFQTTFH